MMRDILVADARYLLDANVCIYLLEGNAPILRARIERCEPGEAVTSAIAFAEVLIGASKQGAFREALFFFRSFPVVPFDDRAAQVYASLPFRRGRFDRLIAAHARSEDLVLVTNNERNFADVPGLRVENWTI